MTTTVVLQGFGPHIRFRTTGETNARVRVITTTEVKTVPLTGETELNFETAA